MKLLLLLVSTLISFHAWSFEYKIDQASLLKPSPLQIYHIGKTFSANGFHSMSDMNLTAAGFAFDRVFVSHEWQSSIVLKAGLRVPAPLLGKVMIDNELGVQVLHFEIEDTPYMVMGINLTQAEFKEATRSWVTSSDSSVRFGWLLPKAQAVTCMTGPRKSLNSATAKALEQDAILKSIGKCGADVMSGLGSSVGSTLSFFKRLVTEPQKLWQETKQSFVELKDFVMNIRDEVGQAFTAFTGLSSEDKAEIACVVAGQLLGTAAQGLLGGAALAKAMPMLLLKLKAGMGILKKLAELANRGIHIPNKSLLAREAMSCAI